MKKMMSLVIVGLVVLLANQVMANNVSEGEALFKAMKCNGCHVPDKDKIGPSMVTISQAYNGDMAKMISYYKKDSPAIVNPAKAKLMDKQLEKKLTGKSDAEISALAAYTLSF